MYKVWKSSRTTKCAFVFKDYMVRQWQMGEAVCLPLSHFPYVLYLMVMDCEVEYSSWERAGNRAGSVLTFSHRKRLTRNVLSGPWQQTQIPHCWFQTDAYMDFMLLWSTFCIGGLCRLLRYRIFCKVIWRYTSYSVVKSWFFDQSKECCCNCVSI